MIKSALSSYGKKKEGRQSASLLSGKPFHFWFSSLFDPAYIGSMAINNEQGKARDDDDQRNIDPVAPLHEERQKQCDNGCYHTGQ